MHRLRLLRCYLAGPMDRCPDSGETWRRMLTPWLEQRGVIVLDPTDKDIELGIEDSASRLEINRLKELEQYDEIRPRFKDISLVDLRMVDIVDFVIVHADLNIYPCGTDEEMFTGNRAKKPILYHMEQGKKFAPNWLFMRWPHELIFGSWDKMKDYLNHIDRAERIDHLNRWRFFNLEAKTRKALGVYET